MNWWCWGPAVRNLMWPEGPQLWLPQCKPMQRACRQVKRKNNHICCLQYCGSGSGIRDLVPFWPLDPGSAIRNRFFPDLGSRIPDPRSQTHIFDGIVTIFWVKSSIILWKLAQIFFRSISLCCCFWIRDRGSRMGKNQDPGSGIYIPDPQNWLFTSDFL